jgi:polyisoprenoid-binding protein YceI
MTPSVATRTRWTIDPSHSEIRFKTRHLVISTVTGSFGRYDAELFSQGDDFAGAEVRFSAEVDSISTGQEARDNHLKSPDFFDAPSHPHITFRSTSFEKTGENTYAVTGDLSIRGTTLPVTLSVVNSGSAVDFYGNHRAGFELKGKISRKAFGLTWDAVTEAGQVVVADEVQLDFDVQMIRQAD